MEDTITLFSNKDMQRMRDDGGSGNWRLDVKRAAKAKYVLICANARDRNGSVRDMDHGAGWLLGKITGLRKEGRRCVVEFSEFAIVCTADPRPSGSRSPIHYTSIDQIGIYPDAFPWGTL